MRAQSILQQQWRRARGRLHWRPLRRGLLIWEKAKRFKGVFDTPLKPPPEVRGWPMVGRNPQQGRPGVPGGLYALEKNTSSVTRVHPGVYMPGDSLKIEVQ